MQIESIQKIYSKVYNSNIELPKIVVIGPQSSGKSSVLEQIVQLDFLPKGLNMVTRCPIIMHLRKNKEEFVIFEGEEKKYKGEEIKKKLEDKTLEICGEFGVSKIPIIITIYLKDTLEITLIDLPGLTKVPVGHQPEDIEIQIKEIVLDYSTGQNTIILAVINANVDIANSESLKIAKVVDKKLERTLAVVTKIDLMDEGTNCIEILQNRKSPLKLGYIGILNRSFQDIQNGLNFEDIKKKEEIYFNQFYSQFIPKIGSVYLLERLYALFYANVKKTIPQIKKKIVELLKEKEDKLVNLSFSYSRNSLIINYFNTLQGVVGDPKKGEFFRFNLENILYDFKMAFNGLILESDFEDLEEKIKSSDSLLFNEGIIKELVRIHTVKLGKQLLIRINTFTNTLKDTIQSITSDLFPLTVVVLKEFTLGMVDKQCNLLVTNLTKYIEIQSMYVNSKYPNFNIPQLLQPRDNYKDINNCYTFNFYSKLESERETIVRITKGYMEIIRTNAIDYSLKSIYFHLIYYLKNEFLKELIEIDLKNGEEIKKIEERKEEIKREIDLLVECSNGID